MQLFGKISIVDPDFAFDQHVNFRNFGNAFFSLFRVATGEGWQDVMMTGSLGACHDDNTNLTDTKNL